ncbi:MAG: Gfo/Idh/MocA family oxidoreductase, partial [Acidobacteria bacterium]|nr:Gfo/Idh/MocA family oxidoreductase [Acidobacteriota bacterium]
MSKTSIGVAVIGAGMAGRAHLAGYRSASTVFGNNLPEVRLVAVADGYHPFAADAARRFGYERAESSWEAIVDADDIDAVSVVLPNNLHREVVEALLESGKHVLCEKPLAGTLEDARAMVEAANRHPGLVTSTGFTFRTSPAINAIRREIEEGHLGTPYFLSSHYWCDYGCDPQGPISWRYKGEPGSGALADIGSHAIDAAEFLFGPIASVRGAHFATLITERPKPLGHAVGHSSTAVSEEVEAVENDDVVVFTAQFSSGAIGNFSASRVSQGLPNSLGFEVFGSAGAATYDLARAGEFSFVDTSSPHTTAGFRQVLVGPQHPNVSGGFAMDFPGVNYGQNDLFVFETRAFLEQIADV